TSTEIEQTDDESFTLHGNLTIKGVTKPVKLKMEFNGMAKDLQGQEKAGFFVSGKINRNDWGLNLNVALEAGGWMIGEDIRIQSEVQFVRQEAGMLLVA